MRSHLPRCLTDTTIRQLKTPDKTRKVSDEKALYLELSPAGGKLWRFEYRLSGEEKRIGLGTFPKYQLTRPRISGSEIVIRPDVFHRLTETVGIESDFFSVTLFLEIQRSPPRKLSVRSRLYRAEPCFLPQDNWQRKLLLRIYSPAASSLLCG